MQNLNFAHSVQVHGIRLYCTDPIPCEIETILSEIRSRIAVSTLHRDNHRFAVFVCNSKWLYAFFSPSSRRSFGIANPVTQFVFVADAEISRNQSRRFGAGHNVRSFVSVATHEMGHVLMRRRFGFWTDRRLPKWLKEGYCEMLAGESSFPEDTGDSLLAEGRSDSSMSFKYFTYRRMVEYLIKERGFTIEQLISDPPRYQEVKEKTRDWIQMRISESGYTQSMSCCKTQKMGTVQTRHNKVMHAVPARCCALPVSFASITVIGRSNVFSFGPPGG